MLIKQLNFRDSDGDEASLYIVTSTACVIPEVRTCLLYTSKLDYKGAYDSNYQYQTYTDEQSAQIKAQADAVVEALAGGASLELSLIHIYLHILMAGAKGSLTCTKESGKL